MKNSKTPLHKRHGKGREFTLQFIRNQIEKGTGKTIVQILNEYPELRRYNLGLQHITTTNKAICEALEIPTEAGTRYKRRLEKIGYLVSSVDVFRCPFTTDLSHLLSTNPKEFGRLQTSSDTQQKLF